MKIHPTKKNFIYYLKKKTSSENLIIAPTTTDEVSDLIHNLKFSKSVGPYSILTKILKISKEVISLSISQLVNDSIYNETFRNICKLAQAITNFKNDSTLLCNSYRPISLLSNISKIYSRLNFLLDQPNLLYPYQFGFRFHYYQLLMHW